MSMKITQSAGTRIIMGITVCGNVDSVLEGVPTVYGGYRDMGYNYSREFLARRPQDVAMIRAVYSTRRPHYLVLDYHTEVVTARHNISNVIRALAMFYPDEFVAVSKKVRTRTDQREDGKWILTVYAPSPGESLVGRPPGRSTANTWIGSAFTPEADSEYQHPDLIKDADTYTEFATKVIVLSPEVKMVQAQFLHEIDVSIIANDPTFEGWIARLNGPTTLILERP